MDYDFSALKPSYQQFAFPYKWGGGVLFLLVVVLFVASLDQFFVMLVLIILAIVILMVVSIIATLTRTKALKKFVSQNGLVECSKSRAYKSIPSAINFLDGGQVIGHGYQFGNVEQGSVIDIFEFNYFTGVGRYKKKHDSTVAVFDTAHQMPHLFLDSVRNGMSHRYETDQHISLEGNFNKYFRLYSPEAANIEALQLITPDVMQALITSGSDYDIEIEGKRIAVFAPGKLFAADTLPPLLHFTDLLRRETAHQSVGWQSLPNDPNPRRASMSRLRRGSYRARAVLVTVACYAAYLLYYSIVVGR